MTASGIRDVSFPTGSPPAADRRTHSRHAVDTTATLILVRTGSRLSGRIVDISLGGCRILCNQWFPVGIFTRIEAEFRIDGISFRLGGVVQGIYDRHTVGIRFLDVSLRKREQVEQLIEEIRETKNQEAE